MFFGEFRLGVEGDVEAEEEYGGVESCGIFPCEGAEEGEVVVEFIGGGEFSFEGEVTGGGSGELFFREADP